MNGSTIKIERTLYWKRQILLLDFLVLLGIGKWPKVLIPTMSSLNSGNLWIFYPSESIFILNGSVERLKSFGMISKLSRFPGIWMEKVENPCFNFCVGDYVGGHLAANVLVIVKIWEIYGFYWASAENKTRISRQRFEPCNSSIYFQLYQYWITNG